MIKNVNNNTYIYFMLFVIIFSCKYNNVNKKVYKNNKLFNSKCKNC